MALELKHAPAARAASHSVTQDEFDATDAHTVTSGAAGDIVWLSTASQISGGHILQMQTNGLTIGLAATAPEPDNNFAHIWQGTAGSVTANAASLLVLENTGTAYMSILAPTVGGILFGDAAANGVGAIKYTHSSNGLSMETAGASSVILTGGATPTLAFQGVTTISTASGAMTLDSGAAINIEPAAGSAILLDGTISIDAGVVIPVATAHNAVGTAVSVSAGATTAGTTNNIAGGSITIAGGQGKGSGAGGSIIFQTANASGSGSSLNSLVTALTISDDLSATLAGDVLVSNGKGLVIGHTAQITAPEASELQLLGTAQTDASMIIGKWGADATGAVIHLVKSRDAVIFDGSYAAVVDNDVVGQIDWLPDDGTDIATLAAVFQAEVDDGSPTTGDIGMAFVWKSMAGGGASLAEAMRVSAAGVLTLATVAVPTISSTNTLTNKRITKRTGTVTSHATPTINTDNVDYFSVTALATAITSMTSSLSGTPVNAQTLWLSFTDDGTGRAIAWGASFEASTTALPTTTVAGARLDVAFVWNTVTSKWRCLAAA